MSLRKKIQYLKHAKENEELNKIVKKLPEDEVVCREMLKLIHNEKVTVEKSKIEKTNTSLYLIMSNKILIGNMEENFTRIQTIAHECIHSIQDLKKLKLHFYFSNFYQIFFILSIILAFFVKEAFWEWMIIGLLLLASIMLYVLRYPLEKDAMTRARDLASTYFEKSKIEKQEREEILKEYDQINQIGIPIYQTYLILNLMIKMGIIIIIYWIC